MLTEKHIQDMAGLILNGKSAQALKEIEKFIGKKTNDTRLFLIKGDALKRLGRDEEAAVAYRKAAEAGGPNAATAWFHAGVQYQRANDTKHAIDAYRRSLALSPNQADAQNNLCVLLYTINQSHEALPHARWLFAHAEKGDHFINAGYVFRTNGLQDEALQCFRRALVLNPDDWRTIGTALQAAQHGCDWPLVKELSGRLTHELYLKGRYDEGRELHLVHISWCMEEAINLEMAKAAARKAVEKVTRNAFNHGKHQWGQRIKVGYVSADFHNHATLHLMGGVFARHDREQFEVFAYCHSRHDNSYFRRRFLQSVEHYVDISKMTDEEAAKRIHEDGIDLLIDLKGFTEKQRLPIFAMRPAPVSATYIGFPGTSGADFLDYAITDAVVTPDSSKPYYSEKLCRLPEVYQCNDQDRIIASNPVSRAEVGLPENAIVFCTFNQPYKIDEVMFDTWMAILRDVPGSVLWILDPGSLAGRHLREAAEQRGIAGDRLIFADKRVPPLHLARIGLADIGLDTRIYNGHTTTSDALWAGVPVVTAPGTHFASRVSATLLRACGLPELVAVSQDEMHRIAVDLANNPKKLAATKTKLAGNRLVYPLYDTERFTRHLEQAYRLMVERAKAGLTPDHIDVPALPPRTIRFIEQVPKKHIHVTHEREDLDTLRKSDRVLLLGFGGCPLCHHDDEVAVRKESWTLPDSYPEDFPRQGFWVQCKQCGHVHSRHYWSPEGAEILSQTAAARDVYAGNPSSMRAFAAKVVERVLQHHKGFAAVRNRKEKLKWFDINPSSAWWYATALEYGIALTGVTPHTNTLQQIKKIGGNAAQADFLNLKINGNPDVISLQGVLETTAFPALYLERAYTLLETGGMLVIAATNVASLAWKVLDQNKQTTCWQSPERLHLFSGQRLSAFVEEKGFTVVDYTVDPTSESGMILYAVKEKKK